MDGCEIAIADADADADAAAGVCVVGYDPRREGKRLEGYTQILRTILCQRAFSAYVVSHVSSVPPMGLGQDPGPRGLPRTGPIPLPPPRTQRPFVVFCGVRQYSNRIWVQSDFHDFRW